MQGVEMDPSLELGILVELGKLVFAVIKDRQKVSKAQSRIRSLVEIHFAPHQELVLNEVLEHPDVVQELLRISPTNQDVILAHFKDAFEAAAGHTWDEGVRHRTETFLRGFMEVLVDIGYRTSQAATALLQGDITRVETRVEEAETRRSSSEKQFAAQLSRIEENQRLSLARSDFEEYLERAVSASGDRYKPEQNVAIDDLKEVFAALTRGAKHLEQLYEARERVNSLRLDAQRALGNETASDRHGALKTLTEALDSIVNKLNPGDQELVPVDLVTQQIDAAIKSLRELRAIKSTIYEHDPYRPDAILQRLSLFLKKEALANESLVGLVGEAGVGKTHYLLQWARETLAEGGLAIIIPASSLKLESTLGQTLLTFFGLGHRWSEKDMLQALSDVAIKSGRRLLIAVDAINEANEAGRWRAALPVFCSTLKSYPWLRMVVSYRPTNRPELFRNAEDIQEIAHPGFRNNEEAALEVLCRHYGIEYASLPPFAPEFANPLFVTLALRSLRSLGQVRWQRGLRGFSQVYNAFLEAANHRISYDLDIDESAAPVRRAVEAFAQRMAEALHGHSRWHYFLPEAEAKSIVDEAWPSRSTERYSESLYKALLDEHILKRFEAYDYANESTIDVVGFAFQRFADHQVAAELLDAYFDDSVTATDLNTAFGPTGLIPLEDAPEGVLTALAIQVPERFGVEILEIEQPTYVWQRDQVRRAVIESFKWRNVAAFPERKDLIELINGRLGGVTDELLEVFLEVSVVPDHPLNASYTSRWLMKMSMAERDVMWTLNINRLEGAVARIISWARHGNVGGLRSEEAMLAGIILSWLLTASHREVRDRATKALVHVLESHPSLAVPLLEHFRNCSDPYVRERLFAAVYGAFLRRPSPDLRGAANWFLDRFFAGGKPFPHLRMRHYAQALVDLAIRRGIIDDKTIRIHRPPYEPQVDLATEEGGTGKDLEAILGQGEGSRLIASSLHCPMGDFGRYVVGYVINRAWGGSYGDCGGMVENALKWMATRILDYGYKDEWFAEFDKSYGRSFRSGGPLERVGKKYQWLAYHEYLAHKTDSSPEILLDGSKCAYAGPWQFWERDIDPSALLPISCSAGPISLPAVELTPLVPRESPWDWLSHDADVPEAARYMTVADDEGSLWYAILANVKGGAEEREVWLQTRAYLTHDAERAARWMEGRDLTGRWLPNWFGPEVRQGFVAEYPWHPSFQEADALTSDFLYPDVGRYDDPIPPGTPKLLSLWAELAWESAHADECSGERIVPLFPSPWLVREGGLVLNQKTWEWHDSGGQLVVVCTSVVGQELNQRHTDALFVSAAWFDDFIASRQLEVIWLVAGEKMVLRQDHRAAAPIAPYRPFGAVRSKRFSEGSWHQSGSQWIRPAD